MAKLAEGNRVYDAVANVAVLASELNDLQDQLRAMCGPQVTDIVGMAPNATDWAWSVDLTLVHGGWTHAGGANPQVWRLPHRTGQKITDITMHASRSGAVNTAGAFGLLKVNIATGATTTIAELDEPWNTGADGVITALTMDEDGSGGAFAAITLESGYFYYVLAYGVGGRTHLVQNMFITAQFGN